MLLVIKCQNQELRGGDPCQQGHAEQAGSCSAVGIVEMQLEDDK